MGLNAGIRLAGITLAAVAFGAAPSVAAASGAHGTPPATYGGSQGKGASTTKFRASYVDGALGVPVSCAGVRIVNRGSGIQDSETCLVADATGIVPGTYTLDSNGHYHLPWLTFPYEFWNSDYDGRLAKSGSASYALNGDGTATETIDVFY